MMFITDLTDLERTALGRGSPDGDYEDAASLDSWTVFALRAVIDGCARLRSERIRAGRPGFSIKDDGSPSIRSEVEVETRVRNALADFDPTAQFVGEETGGTISDVGTCVALDPVDGTWSYISGTETCSMTLAVFRDGEVAVGVVGNPVTGEMAWATRNGTARIIQLGMPPSETEASTLPIFSNQDHPILVHIHPSRAAGPVVAAMYDAWSRDEVRLVRSTGGSPSWALVDAAKGRFTYVSLWGKRAAEPFDLAAACLIVRRAGGEIVGIDGNPIDAAVHEGPFVAGLSAESRERVRGLVASGLEAG
jgi:myo-inositol-1(or 4)-monophosphatase